MKETIQKLLNVIAWVFLVIAVCVTIFNKTASIQNCLMLLVNAVILVGWDIERAIKASKTTVNINY